MKHSGFEDICMNEDRHSDLLKVRGALFGLCIGDALAMPTVAIRAPLIAPLEADDALFNTTNLLTLRNTSLANFFDLPALSLPLPVDGLPVGFMLVGAAMSDRRVFAIGQGVEAAFRAG